jgi:hypothetical protein
MCFDDRRPARPGGEAKAIGNGTAHPAMSAAGALGSPLNHRLMFAAVTLSTGVASGLGGTVLAQLLHYIRHVAYGYDPGYAGTPENFLEGVTNATSARRLAALTTCGLLAGVGWWAVFRFGKPLVSVGQAVGNGSPGPRMPPLTTTAHAVSQIVTVALGSPLGREVAPREIGFPATARAPRGSGSPAMSASGWRRACCCSRWSRWR